MSSHLEPNATAQWEAGELACGQLIVGIKQRLSGLKPGEVLEVTTHDHGARIDIFVWCRMTGQRLLMEAHPSYFIQRADG